MEQRSGQVLLDGAIGDTKALRNLSIGETFDPVKLEDLPRAPWQLRNCLAQRGKRLTGLEVPVDRDRRVGKIGKLIERQRKGQTPLVPTEVVDHEISGDPIEVSAHIAQAGIGGLLGQTHKRLLQQVGGRVATLHLPGEIDLKLSPMCQKQCAQVPLRQCQLRR